MIKHCCNEMDFHLKQREKYISFIPKFREYGLLAGDQIIQTINYCPWCGKKLLVTLRDEWFEEIWARNLNPEDDHSLPQQFKNETWWAGKK